MSSSGVDRTSTQNGTVTNGTGIQAERPPDVTHFGMFNDEINLEISKLDKGWLFMHEAVEGLKKTFRKHGKVVSTVKNRYGEDNVLEQKIHDLEVLQRGFTNLLINNEKEHESKIEVLKQAHDREISEWRGKAAAGEQKQKQYEELEKALKDQLADDRSNMERHFTEKEKEMRDEIRKRIEANRSLKGELKLTSDELDGERAKCQRLEEQNKQLRAPYNAEAPVTTTFYEEHYKALFESIGNIAKAYFGRLPEEVIEDPASISKELTGKKKLAVFKGIPLSDSSGSLHLRLAAIQNIINTVIQTYLWRPFFSACLSSPGKDQDLLPTMYDHLRDRGDPERRNWKISTMRVLDRLDDEVQTKKTVGSLIYHNIIDPLEPLLADDQVEDLRRDLFEVFVEAIDLWKTSERDEFPIQVSMAPDDRQHWNEDLKDYEKRDIPDSLADSAIEPYLRQELAVRPLVTRPNPGKTEHDMICSGAALFSETGIFHDGAVEWKFINGGSKARASTFSSSTPVSPAIPTHKRQGSVSSNVPLVRSPIRAWSGSTGGSGLGLGTEGRGWK
ncbi:hypothetical protein PV08_00621 [Exophiala spinifera]|uniref:Uncharacterized protein n=1 Tax=Exophiala spinifera TaxID=91928 RepID=A0A0D1YXQ6_9EURO|nr:uncharacterized protein PV08_00621 [Exophiala spinifera]KIW20046.1 hypothetical protein PV08_00621 [Exophiala spinifera]